MNALRDLLVIIIFCLFSSFFNDADSVPHHDNFTTVLVCEGGTATFKCPSGYHISIHLANFGRFSLQTCNPTMNLEINTECYNPQTIDILKESCEHNEVCVVSATAENFGDPCPSSTKYLEAKYACLPVKNYNEHRTTTSAPFQQASQRVPDREKGNSRPQKIQNKAHECSWKFERGITWPRSFAGSNVKTSCPEGTTGHAKWHCSQEMQWTPASRPDLSDCVSDWVVELREEIADYNSMEQRVLTSALDDIHTHISHEMVGGDLPQIKVILAEIFQKYQRIMDLYKESIEEIEEQHKQMDKLVKIIIRIVGSLFSDSFKQAWLDLPDAIRHKTSSSLLRLSQQSIESLLPTKLSIVSESSVFAEVSLFGDNDYLQLPSKAPYRSGHEWIKLPRETMQGQDIRTTKISYMSHKNAGHYLMSQRNKESQSFKITSHVVSIFLSSGGKIVPLYLKSDSKPVLITFDGGIHLGTPKCAWWDEINAQFQVESLNERRFCWLLESNRTSAVCACTIMNTHFALLSDPNSLPSKNENLDDPPFLNLLIKAIFIVGCILAIFFISLSLFATMRRRHHDEQLPNIHIRSSISLLLLEFVIVFRTILSYFQIESGFFVFAGFLCHYLIISFFCWIAIEAFQLMRKSSKIEKATHMKFVKQTSKWPLAIGYGLPILIILIAFILNWNFGYQNSEFLEISDSDFLQKRVQQLGVFMGPIGIFLAASILFLLAAFLHIYQPTSYKKAFGENRQFIANTYQPCSINRAQWRNELQKRRLVQLHFKSMALLLFLIGLGSTLLILLVSINESNTLILVATIALINALIGFIFCADVYMVVKGFHLAEPHQEKSRCNKELLFCCGCASKSPIQQRTSKKSGGGSTKLSLSNNPLESPNSSSNFTPNASIPGTTIESNRGATSEYSEATVDCAYLPPPSPLLQVLRQKQRQMAKGSSAVATDGLYEYATIPYDEIGRLIPGGCFAETLLESSEAAVLETSKHCKHHQCPISPPPPPPNADLKLSNPAAFYFHSPYVGRVNNHCGRGVGSNNTLILKMDLNRATPVYSEQVVDEE